MGVTHINEDEDLNNPSQKDDVGPGPQVRWRMPLELNFLDFLVDPS